MCEIGTLQLSILRGPRHTDGKRPYLSYLRI